MQLRLLGPVELWAGDEAVDIGPAKRRAVLAALAVEAGRPVPIDTLVDRVWERETAPARARSVIYAHVSRLREALAGDPTMRIMRQPGGYVLLAPAGTIDLHHFTDLTRQARACERDDTARSCLLRQALDLWNGTALADIGGSWAARVREWYARQRIDVAAAWAEAGLRLHRPTAVLPELQALAAEEPLAEELIVTIMAALHAAGRDAEALSWYATTVRRLADELGTDPGPRLRRAHHAALRSTGDTAPEIGATAQPPPAVPGFVGRVDELAQLDALRRLRAETADATVIATVSGMAGVGKTSLAVHWAHRAARRFDGQLYVDLHGYDGVGRVEPVDAMRGFLEALGVAPDEVPGHPDQVATMWRTALAGRRILILLDNAHDSEHVRPLLPHSPGCLVVVTSRDQLTGLVVTEGARPVPLSPLSDDEAHELLEQRLGYERIAGEQDAMREIVASCGQLPLALAMVAGRAALHPRFPLTSIAAELAGAAGDVGALLDDTGTDLRLVLSWSYDGLGEDAARLFRLLGLHPAGEFSLAAAASLAGLDPPTTRRMLAQLSAASLVTEVAPGRYALHDLLRSYAADLVRSSRFAAEGESAVDRVLDHYVRAACAASQTLAPHRDPPRLPEPPAGVTYEPPGDYQAALRWFASSWPTLRRLVEQAVASERDVYTGPLAWALYTYFERVGLWQPQADVERLALMSAERLGDRAQQLQARRSLAAAYTLLGDYDLAAEHFFGALALAEQVGDGVPLGHVLYGIAWMYTTQEHVGEALGHARRALDQFRAVRHSSGEARCLNMIGWVLTQLGQAEQAVEHCEQALRIHDASGDTWCIAETWDTLGVAQHALRRDDDAIDSFRRSLRLCAELGDHFREAQTLDHLGDALAAAGDRGAARDSWARAAALLDELAHPDAAKLRQKLQDELQPL